MRDLLLSVSIAIWFSLIVITVGGLVQAETVHTHQVVIYRTQPRCPKPVAVILPMRNAPGAHITVWICEGVNE